jgi:hypothetical protein
MSDKESSDEFISDRQEAAELSVRAGSAFQPRAPISTREFFAGRLSRVVRIADVHKSLERAVEQASQSTREKYLTATHSAHRGALYDKVILACAAASSSAKDALGYFHASDLVAPISYILSRPSVPIAAFQRHIHEFCEPPRGQVLERAGAPRAYKYRFHDPLLPPYIFMKAVAEGHIDIVRLTQITSGD